MKYWLTTQWPPLAGRNYAAPFDSEDNKPYVWLRDEHYDDVGKPLREGDLVVVYEIGYGPTEVRTPDGTMPYRCQQPGRKGIIFYGRVKSGFEQRQGSRNAKYVCSNWKSDREMWWEWRAPIKILCKGRIRFSKVKAALRDAEEPMAFNPLGFGHGTGLMEITKTQYDALIKLFDAATTQ